MSKIVNKKHILTIVAASLASLSIATAAHAGAPGAYVGGQLGWGKTNQGNFALPTVTPFLATGSTLNTGSSTDAGLAGRVFGGYQFNPFVAAELGYTKFHNATAKASESTSASLPLGAATSASANGTVKTDAFDLVAKGILPLQKGFSVYGKLGAAYLRTSGNVKVTTQSNSVLGSQITTTVSQSAHKILPTFGAGVSYDITKHVVADVSWNHIQMVGHSTKLNNTDFVGAGLSYNFG